MTFTHYCLARLLRKINIAPRSYYVAEAVKEVALLQEGKEILGLLLWDKLDQVEELSVEYWNLRKKLREKEIAASKLAEISNTIDAPYSSAEIQNPEQPTELVKEKQTELSSNIEKLKQERQLINEQAHEIKRIFEGLKVKYEVLYEEEEKADKQKETLMQTREELSNLKEKFKELQAKKLDLQERMASAVNLHTEHENHIKQQKSKQKSDLVNEISKYSKANRNFTKLRNSLHALESECSNLFCVVGDFFLSYGTSEKYQEISKPHLPTIIKLQAIEKSIQYMESIIGNVYNPHVTN